MEEILIDIKELNVSPEINVNDDDLITDLMLEDISIEEKGYITGTITDELSAPIVGATIIITNTTGTPLTHTQTDSDGKYNVVLDEGEYLLNVIKTGYKATNVGNVIVTNGEETVVNAILIYDPQTEQNIIYGFVKEAVSNNPIENVTIYLRETTENKIVAMTSTIADGQYIFDNIPTGEYILVYIADCYLPYSLPSFIIANNEVIEKNALLEPGYVIDSGTVSGVISDHLAQPVINAFVALYRIDLGLETFVAKTYTNNAGYYAFADIPVGNYLIKSKESSMNV